MRGFRSILGAFVVSPLFAAVGLSAEDSPKTKTADAEGWITLVGPETGLDAFRPSTGAWRVVGSASIDPENPRRLDSAPGSGVIVNDPPGRTRNLVTKESFRDLELRAEFMVPEHSNSGIKFMGLYEIQIHDSYGADPPKANHNGGIYPRAELLPRYHHIDEGFPPKVNASKPAGEWQRLEAVFRAPRFDGDGRKTAHARFELVKLNDQVIHEDQEVPYPTGHAWRTKAERPEGPLLFQADHGPVAFRNVLVRPLDDRPED